MNYSSTLDDGSSGGGGDDFELEQLLQVRDHLIEHFLNDEDNEGPSASIREVLTSLPCSSTGRTGSTSMDDFVERLCQSMQERVDTLDVLPMTQDVIANEQIMSPDGPRAMQLTHTALTAAHVYAHEWAHAIDGAPTTDSFIAVR